MSGMTMLDYVRECPVRLNENVKRREELCDALVERYRSAVAAGHASMRFVACGSSYHACRAMQPFMEHVLGARVDVVTPGYYVRYGTTMSPAFEVMVSQSGCSTNIIAALDTVRELGCEAVVLTGNIEADVRGHADAVVDYGVGVETVGFVTVGLVTLMEFLTLFALTCAERTGEISVGELERWMAELEEAAALHGALATRMEAVFEAHELAFLSPGPTFVLGDGPNYATALEGALKIQETLKVPAITYEPEEFIHGPNMQLTPAYTVFVIDTDPMPGRTFDIWRAASEVTDRAYLVSTRPGKDERIIAAEGHAVSELISPIALVAPFQYLCARTMSELDCEDEHPLMRRFERIVSSKTESYRAAHQ